MNGDDPGPRVRFLGVLTAVFVASAFVAGGVCMFFIARHVADATPLPAAATPSGGRSPEVGADWCAPEYEPIRGGGCFAGPPGERFSQALIVYLHGRYARDAAADEVDRQRRLAARATGRGFAVVALRGALGTCTDVDLAQWFCWPSNARNADSAAAVVSAWTQALESAHERAGSGKRFVLGFSNGGYFAGLIAARGLLDVDALVVAHGGWVEPAQGRLRDKPPLLLLSADDDVAQDDMIAYDEELALEHWPHDSYARSGGHELTDEDIDAALTFFSRATEPLPLQPPLALHRAARHVRPTGVASESPDLLDGSVGQGESGASSGASAGPSDSEAPAVPEDLPRPADASAPDVPVGPVDPRASRDASEDAPAQGNYPSASAEAPDRSQESSIEKSYDAGAVDYVTRSDEASPP
jgi:predicted esterase